MKLSISRFIFAHAVALICGLNFFCVLGPNAGDVDNPASPFSGEYYAAQALLCGADATCSGTTTTASTLRLVAVGAAGRGYYSDDGRTWAAVNISQNVNKNFNSVTWDGTHFIAVGTDATTNDNIASYSSDGINWTTSTFNTNCTNPATLFDVESGNGRLVAVGDANGGSNVCVQVSTDNGVTWTQGTGTGTFYTRVAYTSSGFVAMEGPALNAPVYTSADGTSFSAAGAPFTGGGFQTTAGDLDVLSDSTTILYLGTDGTAPTGNMHAAVSTNGGTTFTPTANNVFQGIAVPELPFASADNGSRLVVVGDSCRLDYSDSLTSITWNHGTAMTGCASVSWTDIVHTGTEFVALGSISGGSGHAAFSGTGLPGDWTIATLPDSTTPINEMALRP